MAILEVIEGLVQVVGHSVEGLAGWRYLLSSTYRRRVHTRWSSMNRLAVVGEIFMFFISFIFVTLLVAGVVWLMVSPAR